MNEPNASLLPLIDCDVIRQEAVRRLGREIDERIVEFVGEHVAKLRLLECEPAIRLLDSVVRDSIAAHLRR